MIELSDTAIFKRDEDRNQPYIKIDEEWIRYSGIKDEHHLIIAADGRGDRGTVPAAHTGSSEVETGSTFVLTFDIPSYRELKE